MILRPCESGQWMRSGAGMWAALGSRGAARLLGGAPDVPLPARAHLSALRLPLNGTLALDHLLFLHAWVALGLLGEEEKKKWTISRLSPRWRFDVWSVIALGLRPLSLEGFDMKSRPGSQVYPIAADPGLKQSAYSLWDTITRESIGASSAMKYAFLPSYKHIWDVLIELYQFTKAINGF